MLRLRPTPGLVFLFLAFVLFVTAAQAEEAKGLWQREHLTGDWGGHRTSLENYGIRLGATEVLDVQSNVRGGVFQELAPTGRLELDLDADLQKLIGVQGLTFHASAVQFHGHSLEEALNENFLEPSGAEGEHAFRLFTLWFEQRLMNDDVNVRFGQIAADDEFATTEMGELFLNDAPGWPGALNEALPSGGPTDAFAAPGLRVRAGQNKPWSIMGAVFSGDPAPGPGSKQENNPSGTRFETQSDALLMTEGAYSHGGGTYKAGAWLHTGDFGDQRLDNSGLSQADPATTGVPKSRGMNYGFYGVIEQMLWRAEGDDEEGEAGEEEEGRGIGAFLKGFIQPDDRNVGFWEIDAGITARGMLFGREDDTLGLAFSYLGISPQASALDRDTNFFTATAGPVRDCEAMIELTYQAEITPWLILQPDFQYIFHPGGNVADPNGPGTTSVPDAAIIGFRTILNL